MNRELNNLFQWIPSPSFPLLLLAGACSLLVFFLVLSWALLFNSSFRPQPSLTSSDLGLTYAVLHPLFMVFGFILITGEAILVHRWFPGSRKLKKSVHPWLQGMALACGVLGNWTKFSGIDGVLQPPFLDGIELYLPLQCPGASGTGDTRSTRTNVLPWHVFLGLYTYGLAIATAETGLLEKLTFLQASGCAARRRSPDSMVAQWFGSGFGPLE